MSDTDLTVAVTAHNESLVAGPSMRSAEIAIHAVELEGFRTERLIGLDAPTDECRTFFSQSDFAAWRVTEFDFSDPYLTRNALAEMASARWLAFLDADDLLSENWLMEAVKLLAQAESLEEKIIVHPELNWGFDGAHSLFTKPSQDDSLFTPYYYYFSNYYDMLCMSPTRAHLEIPYARRNLVNGFGFGDWQWGIETMAAGWRHAIAKNTIIFKRRRDWSVVLENGARRTIVPQIEAMAIDKVSGLARGP